MAWTNYEFDVGDQHIKVQYDVKMNRVADKGTAVHKRWIKEAFEYMCQTDHGKAIVKTAMKYKDPYTGQKKEGIRIWFYNSSAYDPKPDLHDPEIHESLERYWHSNLRYTVFLLFLWGVGGLGFGVLLADFLNSFMVPGTGYPVGFWFAAHFLQLTHC